MITLWKDMKRTELTRTALIYFAFLLAATPMGSFALYRGDEYDGRDFTFDAEYYIDELSIQPPLEDILAYRYADSGLIGYAGSYTRRDLFAEVDFKLQHEFEDPFDVSFRFKTGQDFDGIYTHYLLGLGYEFIDDWTISVVGEPLAHKELSDIGLALESRQQNLHLRAEVLAPNFGFDNSNDLEGSFEKQPWNFNLNTYIAINDVLTGFVVADLDFPSETKYKAPAFDFTFHSYKPAAGLIWNISTRRRLWGQASLENTREERKGYEPGDVNDFITDRDSHSTLIEYIWDSRSGRHRVSTGLEWVHFKENNDHPNSRNETVDYDHTSHILYSTWRRHLVGDFYFSTGAYIDIVQHEQDYRYRINGKSDSDGWEGRIPLGLEWRGENFRISGGIAAQIDQATFAGGYGGAMFLF